MASLDRGVPSEARESPGGKSAEDFAALESCLIGGDAEQTGRERKSRRRSLVLSSLMQAAVLLAVIAIPFFSKAERIAMKDFTPIQPYHQIGNTTHEHTATQPPPTGPRICVMCPMSR